MKTYKTTTSLSALLALIIAPVALHSATLIDGGSIALGSAADISVSSGNEGFSTAGGGAGTAFNGPVYDYAFYNTNADPSVPNVTGTRGLIGSLSDAAGTDDKINLWTTSNPGSEAADFASYGVRWADNATFTVDISGLSSGSIYVFNGSWQARTDWLDLSMTGDGQTAIEETNFATSPAVGSLSMNAKRIDFTDAADYDLITFTLQESGAQSGYWGGVVITNVTAIPEPSAFALLAGMFGLTWIMLRRRS